jgi:TRAP-type C4-dicarboxylate transport system permease small subunit
MSRRDAGAPTRYGTICTRFCRCHDAINRVGYILGAALLGAIVSIYSYEVAARHFFTAPTKWASDFVTYFQCMMIFTVMPEITRRAEHVAITLIPEALPPSAAEILHKFTLAAGAFCCAVAAWFSIQANISQFEQQVTTVAAIPIPKWWVSSFMTYGFAGSALYFLRPLCLPAGPDEYGGDRVKGAD